MIFKFQTKFKNKIKTNPKMCILMYFIIQSDQPRITWNTLKSQVFGLTAFSEFARFSEVLQG